VVVSHTQDARTVLARYSIPKVVVALALLLTVVVAMILVMSETYHVDARGQLDPVFPNFFVGLAIVAVPMLRTLLAAFRLLAGGGKAVWLEDGRLHWSVYRRSADASMIREVGSSFSVSAGRKIFLPHVFITFSDGPARAFSTLLMAGSEVDVGDAITAAGIGTRR
jgi:hypothetical protein